MLSNPVCPLVLSCALTVACSDVPPLVCASRIDYMSILGLPNDLNNDQGTLYYTLLRDSFCLMTVIFVCANHYLLAAFGMIDEHFLGVEIWTMALDPLVAGLMLPAIALCPLDFFHRPARIAIFWNFVGLITHFGGAVPYSLALFADVLTSLVQVLHWLMHSFCSCAKLFEPDQQAVPPQNVPHTLTRIVPWMGGPVLHESAELQWHPPQVRRHRYVLVQ